MGLFGRSTDPRDVQVCDAALRDQIKGEQRLLATLQQRPGDAKARASLAGLQAHIRGQRAKCIMEQSRIRKEKTYQSRATRAGHKAEIAARKQEIRQAKIATALQREELRAQRFQLRQQKLEAGAAIPASKLALGAAIAGAAVMLLR
jgi:hypothetical protein